MPQAIGHSAPENWFWHCVLIPISPSVTPSARYDTNVGVQSGYKLLFLLAIPA
jgi:hypothetical protein